MFASNTRYTAMSDLLYSHCPWSNDIHSRCQGLVSEFNGIYLHRNNLAQVWAEIGYEISLSQEIGGTESDRWM